MSENVEKCPKFSPTGRGTQFSDIFGQCLPIWSMLLFGDPAQCSPVTTFVKTNRSKQGLKLISHRQARKLFQEPVYVEKLPNSDLILLLVLTQSARDSTNFENLTSDQIEQIQSLDHHIIKPRQGRKVY